MAADAWVKHNAHEKPTLIDLEALTRVTGGKRKQPERLSEWASKDEATVWTPI